MRLVGKSLAPEVVLREMLHLMSELLGLNRGRVVLADFVGDIAGRSGGPQTNRARNWGNGSGVGHSLIMQCNVI